jgi:hypothetical protein
MIERSQGVWFIGENSLREDRYLPPFYSINLPLDETIIDNMAACGEFLTNRSQIIVNFPEDHDLGFI